MHHVSIGRVEKRDTQQCIHTNFEGQESRRWEVTACHTQTVSVIFNHSLWKNAAAALSFLFMSVFSESKGEFLEVFIFTSLKEKWIHKSAEGNSNLYRQNLSVRVPYGAASHKRFLIPWDKYRVLHHCTTYRIFKASTRVTAQTLGKDAVCGSGSQVWGFLFCLFFVLITASSHQDAILRSLCPSSFQCLFDLLQSKSFMVDLISWNW